MRLLLDTHVLLWALGLPEELRPDARRAIADPSNDVLVSTASAWEIAIKRALGRLDAPDDLAEALEVVGFDELPIRLEHALAVERLPPHHRDPFDRMLIAQALSEGLTIVTRDPRFAAYGVPLLAA
jgi:PIN domain nuclease of toxin-antitoxin system